MKKHIQLLVAVLLLGTATLNVRAGEDSEVVGIWTGAPYYMSGGISVDVGYAYYPSGDYTLYLSITDGGSVSILVELEYTHFSYYVDDPGNYVDSVTNGGDWASVSVSGLPSGYYTVAAYTPTVSNPSINVWPW